MNKYKLLSYITSGLYLYLFILLLVFPDSLCRDIGITANASVLFLARRAAMLMLGFSVLVFSGRKLPPSVPRQAIVLAVAINMAGLAISSIVELLRGVVDIAILKAFAIELLVATLFFTLWGYDRQFLKR